MAWSLRTPLSGNIVFDEQSQYVIASMGVVGVLVDNAKEELGTPVSVGP